jgi:DNA polymerase-3 subunit delta
VTVSRSRRTEFESYDDFLQSLNEGRFAPIYLLVGKEDFLVDECVDRIVTTLVPHEMRGFNLDVVYGSKLEAKDVIAHASSFPMMGDRRVVVVKEFEKLVLGETAKEIVGHYIQHPLESTCLVLTSEEPDFRKRPFTDLKKSAKIYACRPLYDNEVPAWIQNWVRSKGKMISIDACQLLQAYVGNSLRSLDNEIQKLLIYTADQNEITQTNINAVAGASREYTIFDLQNSIGKRDAKVALTILARMMETGESPQMIIVMLTRFFTTLMKIGELRARRVSEQELASQFRFSPNIFRQYLESCANFSAVELERNFRALLSADTTLKTTSNSDPRLVMDLLVYSLVSKASQPSVFSA